MMAVMDGIVHYIDDADVLLHGRGLEKRSYCPRRRLRNLYLVGLSCDAMGFNHASFCCPSFYWGSYLIELNE